MTRRTPRIRALHHAWLCGALLLADDPASACPVCDRETGRQVRAGLFDEDFGFNLLATSLPFVVFLGIAAAIHFELPLRKSTASTRTLRDTPTHREEDQSWPSNSVAGP